MLQQAYSKRITAFIGANGCGKTNIMDAIYYLCYSRSYFTKSDKQVGNFNTLGFRVDGFFEKNDIQNHTSCIYREEGKKEIWLNEEQLKKASSLLGLHSCVMIAPDDISLINEGSEERRKYIDAILCQIDGNYLIQLQAYNKIILQRNALLKQLQQTLNQQKNLLQVYNQQLHQCGSYIYQQRVKHLQQIKPLVLHNYNTVANNNEAIEMLYQSQLHQHSLIDLLSYNEQKDLASQRTNYGIHKDDLICTLQQEPFKAIASQGQKKSLLLAMKLAELQYLQQHLKSQPILLLDDIFERLDNDRMQNLFGHIYNNTTAQIFITDTNAQRVKDLLQPLTIDFEIVVL